ncbi:DUF2892 domain-containing protein [Bacillus atrophaeus]|uniref:YgaP family membrane protein n=1 Tax=Bacillus atrophaeus TaxID=1452 RepID=UPI0009C0E5C0|nr:DUF2892 domain-containing protein [Bacillus atrophaeus]MCY8466716.1 DUF2892 domain-containing protein [Bacillus atrophaeus]MCY8479664.1 DUF2892 domain-containing protein [Bacillus atrophaeus]MCY8486972.1 DUF2892 domain-containing protein [Bacillus atrophaeus]MCY8490994.1 DUF2892 domain-containing protein [Bacillus atrophaeus]MCY8907240.1 DUF2892 domain-containing protein [Bacillus atrophaeus]
MKQNISLLNAVFRIACGLTLMSAAAAKYTRKPWCKMTLFCIFMGGMKAASGILRFCPVTYMCQNAANTNHNEQREK